MWYIKTFCLNLLSLSFRYYDAVYFNLFLYQTSVHRHNSLGGKINKKSTCIKFITTVTHKIHEINKYFKKMHIMQIVTIHVTYLLINLILHI